MMQATVYTVYGIKIYYTFGEYQRECDCRTLLDVCNGYSSFGLSL